MTDKEHDQIARELASYNGLLDRFIEGLNSQGQAINRLDTRLATLEGILKPKTKQPGFLSSVLTIITLGLR